MSKKLFSLLLLFVTAMAARAQVTQIGGDTLQMDYAHPKDYVIEGLRTSGTQFLEESVLLDNTGLHKGDSIQVPGEKITNAIKNLWKQGFFSDIDIVAEKIIGNKIFLDIQLKERPKLSHFSFKGDVSKGEADKLREEIKLERGKVVTKNTISHTYNVVRSFYADKGYMAVEVKVAEVVDTSYANSEVIEIFVKKHAKFKIYSITFEGNHTIPDKHLRKAMKDTKMYHWYNIFTTSKFLEDKYRDDKQNIIAKYLDIGYRDAKIVYDTVYKYSEDMVKIYIRIDEGNQYHFRNINFVGNTKYRSSYLDSILAIKKGDVYNQSELEKRISLNPNGKDITSLYMDDGYLFFQVTPVEVAVENDSIDLEIRIYEGKQARINKVTVTGNTKTNDRVVMREIRTRPGQLFNRSDIIRTQRELAQLGYFDPEKLGVNPKPNPQDGTVDIEYVVAEKASDQVELSGGYGANQLVGTLGLTFNNFSARNFFKKGAWNPLPAGDGQRLSLRAQTNGAQYTSYNISFTEPWLGGKKPNSLSVSAFHSVQSNGLPDNNPLRQSLTITGGSVGLGKRLRKPDDFFTLYSEVGYQYYVLNNFTSTFLFSNGTSNNLSFGETISRNSIDAPIYPRSGSQVSLSVKFTPPYSLWSGIDYKTADDATKYKWIEYHKWKFTSSWFTRITGNLVLNAKMYYGFLGLYNHDLGPSPFERFYLGGDGLSGFALDGREIIGLRGYANNSLTAKDVNGNYIGSTIFDKYTLEVRYPLSLNPNATIYLLTFAEAGNSWSYFKDFDPFASYRSLGGGVKIFLPMFGLLGLDWGYGFDDIPNDINHSQSRGQFHFSIGQQF
jgi:outer membrane protein insertion porin family